MKKKRTQILLFIGVFIVWGIIFLKLYNYFFKTEENTFSESQITKALPKSLDNDTLGLLLNYDDPFGIQKSVLNPVFKHTSPKKNISTNKKENTPVKIRPFLIPEISYRGIIQNSKKAKNIGIVFYSNGSVLIKPGDSIENWIVKELRRDSLLISCSGQNVWIHINKNRP